MSHTTLEQVLKQAQTQTGAGHIDEALATLLLTLANCSKQISKNVSRGALAGILGSAGTENVQGETQKQLDVIANDMLIDALLPTGLVAAIASEEMDNCLPATGHESAPYLVLFDPLDGSSNIDVNVSIGTIFSVLPTPKGQPINDAAFLQSGRHQVAAGYMVYGPQTQMVLSTGHGVMGFTLDTNTGEYLLTSQAMTISPATKEFAINMSNVRHWYGPVRRYVDELLEGKTGPRAKDFNMRWIASMVADVHRVLTRGGIFMYPKDQRDPNKPGKLRLMYEANPMSFLVEQAGGQSHDGIQRILDIQPTELHQRCSVMLGSAEEINRLFEYHQAA